MINILNTNSIENKYVNIILHGHTGAGKTRLACTSESPLILSSESGLLSVIDKDIDYIEIDKFDDYLDAYKFINNSKDANKYKTVIIDSISELGEILLTEEQKKVNDGRLAYLSVKKRIFSSVRLFRSLNINVIMTAKTVPSQDEESNRLFMPSLPGDKATRGLAYQFDEVFALRVSENKSDDKNDPTRFMQTVQCNEWIAKDRSGNLDRIEVIDKHDDSAMKDLINKMIGVSD